MLGVGGSPQEGIALALLEGVGEHGDEDVLQDLWGGSTNVRHIKDRVSHRIFSGGGKDVTCKATPHRGGGGGGGGLGVPPRKYRYFEAVSA